jgi:hypothetical protein
MTPGGDVVCTLAEGDYFRGVAGLANSLVASGFAGEILVGHRGPPPPWLPAASAGGVIALSPQASLRLVPYPGPWHLNNHKPHFIRDALRIHRPDAGIVYYFDTDVVVTRRWSTFAEWARQGVVLALDVADSFMPPTHVYRHAWRALAAGCGLPCRDISGYVNGGCVGVSRRDAGFVDVWSDLMDALAARGVDMRVMKDESGDLAFARRDQDVLNAAMMATQCPLAVLGYESMGQYPWVNAVMHHAMFHAKPWKRNYVIDALRGFPPHRTHLAYWRFAEGPLRPFTPAELRLKRLNLELGRLISLLHMRSYRDI